MNFWERRSFVLAFLLASVSCTAATDDNEGIPDSAIIRLLEDKGFISIWHVDQYRRKYQQDVWHIDATLSLREISKGVCVARLVQMDVRKTGSEIEIVELHDRKQLALKPCESVKIADFVPVTGKTTDERLADASNALLRIVGMRGVAGEGLTFVFENDEAQRLMWQIKPTSFSELNFELGARTETAYFRLDEIAPRELALRISHGGEANVQVFIYIDTGPDTLR